MYHSRKSTRSRWLPESRHLPNLSASDPGSGLIDKDVVLEADTDVVGYINGGHTALPDNQIRCICEGCKRGLELVHNGNERAALDARSHALAGPNRRRRNATRVYDGLGAAPAAKMWIIRIMVLAEPCLPRDMRIFNQA
jgi:hypothetical protein